MLDIAFGILCWVVTASHLLPNNTGWDPVPDLKCVIFSSSGYVIETSSNGRETVVLGSIKSSSLCGAIIGLGVLSTIALLAAAVWYSLRYVNKPSMSVAVESVVLGSLSTIWFTLGIAAIVDSSANFRNVIVELRVCIASAWIAGFTHFAGVVVAEVQQRQSRKRKSSPIIVPDTLEWQNGAQQANAEDISAVGHNTPGAPPAVGNVVHGGMGTHPQPPGSMPMHHGNGLQGNVHAS